MKKDIVKSREKRYEARTNRRAARTSSKSIANPITDGWAGKYRGKTQTWCGLYKITNTLTNQFYVGRSVNLFGRWNQHLQALVSHSHSPKFQAAFHRKDIAYWTFQILEVCDPSVVVIKEELLLLTVKNDPFNLNSAFPASSKEMLLKKLAKKLSQSHTIQTDIQCIDVDTCDTDIQLTIITTTQNEE